LVASPPPVPGSAAFIHREIVQLLGLIAVVVLAFFATRAIARTERGLVLREAAEWYREGERQLEAGRPAAAVDALQRAVARNRGEKQYALALARAMALAGDRPAARTTLLALREAAPEDIEINLQLARLAATDGDLSEALRYYRNALYAPWPTERADERRQLRVELIRFLLAQGAERAALTELTALQANLPDDPAAHVLAARLFSEAGDHRRALEQYQTALRLDPARPDALAGAGLAAFDLGDYRLAASYLDRAPSHLPRVGEARILANLILANDPLAPRLGSPERARRLRAGFLHAARRLDACLAAHPDAAAGGEGESLERDVRAFRARLRSPGVREQDTVEAGVDLMARIEWLTAERCPPASPLDEALRLIGRQHGAAER